MANFLVLVALSTAKDNAPKDPSFSRMKFPSFISNLRWERKWGSIFFIIRKKLGNQEDIGQILRKIKKKQIFLPPPPL